MISDFLGLLPVVIENLKDLVSLKDLKARVQVTSNFGQVHNNITKLAKSFSIFVVDLQDE